MRWSVATLFALMLVLASCCPASANPFYLGDTKEQEAAEYMAPRYFEPKAGIVLTFDDGWDGFYDHFVPISDDIKEAKDVRVRGTTSLDLTKIGIESAFMTWAEVRAIDQRQDDADYPFEIALHADGDGTMGSRRSGFSKVWMDSSLGAWQGVLRTNNVTEAKSFILARHRFTPGMEDVWKGNGIYQVGGLAVPVSGDSTTSGPLSNERSPMELNYSPYPQSAAGNGFGGAGYVGTQRHGGIMNRWNVGRRGSYNNVDDTLTEIIDYIEMCVQYREIGFLTLHDIDTDTSDPLTITPANLTTIMNLIADYQAAGLLESLTFEQAVARGTGHVHGNLLNHTAKLNGELTNFVTLADINASTNWSKGASNPIGWPFDNTEDVFYTLPAETLSVATASLDDSTDVKVWNLSADGDTVLAIYTAEGIADSVSYGATSPNGNVIMTTVDQAGGQSYSWGIYYFAQTTGVQAPYVELTVQAMVNNGTSATGYLGCRGFQWAEDWSDIVNSGPNSYDFSITTSGQQSTVRGADVELQEARIRPLFNLAVLDSTIFNDGANVAAGASFWYNDDDNFLHRALSMGNLPPAVYDGQGSIDKKTPYGNFEDIDAVDSNDQTYTQNLDAFDASSTFDGTNYGSAVWRNYIWRIPIMPGMTDWVSGYVYLRREAAFSGNPTLIISDINIVAGRG